MHPNPAFRKAQEAEALRGMADALSAARGSRLAPKAPWTSAKMSPGAMERLILPFQLVIDEVASTFKMGQNKTPRQRHGVAAELTAQGRESPATAIARRMVGL
jgi:transcriptional regulator